MRKRQRAVFLVMMLVAAWMARVRIDQVSNRAAGRRRWYGRKRKLLITRYDLRKHSRRRQLVSRVSFGRYNR